MSNKPDDPIVLSPEAFVEFMRHMLNPGPISPRMIEAAALHKVLREQLNDPRRYLTPPSKDVGDMPA